MKKIVFSAVTLAIGSLGLLAIPAIAAAASTSVGGPILVHPPCCYPIKPTPPISVHPVGPTKAPPPWNFNPGGPIRPVQPLSNP